MQEKLPIQRLPWFPKPTSQTGWFIIGVITFACLLTVTERRHLETHQELQNLRIVLAKGLLKEDAPTTITTAKKGCPTCGLKKAQNVSGPISTSQGTAWRVIPAKSLIEPVTEPLKPIPETDNPSDDQQVFGSDATGPEKRQTETLPPSATNEGRQGPTTPAQSTLPRDWRAREHEQLNGRQQDPPASRS